MAASAVGHIANLLSLFVLGGTGCAPPNAPYVVYTDERGQVTCAACVHRLTPAHLVFCAPAYALPGGQASTLAIPIPVVQPCKTRGQH